jgi:hypothetical protein
MFVFACGLLLTVISAAPARAATAVPPAIAPDSSAPGESPAVTDAGPASSPHQVINRQPVHDSNSQEPADSRDLIDEEDDDDDEGAQDGHGRHSAALSVDEILGLRCPSRTSEAPLSPDGTSFAPTYLTDSVRRL